MTKIEINNDSECNEKINKNWAAIVNYMDSDVREQVHRELAPCSNEEFLQRYLELDPEFITTLKQEFGIKM